MTKIKEIERSNFSPELLKRFSRDHLYYEIWMCYELCDRLYQGVDDVVVRNALLESFLVHARIILDFLYDKANYPDDVIAADFFKDRSHWESIIPKKSDLLNDIHKRGHKEVVHLSYKRLDVEPAKKPWNYYNIKKEIAYLINLFLENSDKDLLDHKIYTLRQ